jgi:hypothetical protein
VLCFDGFLIQLNCLCIFRNNYYHSVEFTEIFSKSSCLLSIIICGDSSEFAIRNNIMCAQIMSVLLIAILSDTLWQELVYSNTIPSFKTVVREKKYFRSSTHTHTYTHTHTHTHKRDKRRRNMSCEWQSHLCTHLLWVKHIIKNLKRTVPLT